MTDRSRVFFFNASLANGHLMSRPVYEPKYALIGELMRSIENESPYAVWVQIIFAVKNYSRHFTFLKHRIAEAIRDIEAPKVSIFTGKELGDKAAKFRDFYTGSPWRLKKIDESLSKPLVLMGIQGMWISEDDQESRRRASHLEEILPFSHCHDEIDRLAVYEYSDPRLLIELVDRRIVTDLSKYFRSYTGARMEPPSFIISADELSSYVHIPSRYQADKIHSMTWGSASISPRISAMNGQIEGAAENGVSILEANELPRWGEELDENQMARLALLASDTERSFELVYESGLPPRQVTWFCKTSIFISEFHHCYRSYGEYDNRNDCFYPPIFDPPRRRSSSSTN